MTLQVTLTPLAPLPPTSQRTLASRPGAPLGPVAPFGPEAPLAPAGPALPSLPSLPVGPSLPSFPGAPCAPFWPAGPCGPTAPCGPTGPIGPSMTGWDWLSPVSVTFSSPGEVLVAKTSASSEVTSARAGAKRTSTVHDPPGCTVTCEQESSATTKSPRDAGSVASTDTPEITSGSSPVSVTVTSWPGPIVPTCCVGNTGVLAAKAGPGPAFGTIFTVFVAVIGSSDSGPVYLRIESLVTDTSTAPGASPVSDPSDGSRIAVLPAALAASIAAWPLPIARFGEPPQSTDIG